MKHAVLLSAAFALACAAEQRQLTPSDAYNADAPVAAAEHASALTPEAHGHEAPAEQAHAHPGDAGAAVYSCPMHPEVRGSSPEERCPKCGMKLERRP